MIVEDFAKRIADAEGVELAASNALGFVFDDSRVNLLIDAMNPVNNLTVPERKSILDNYNAYIPTAFDNWGQIMGNNWTPLIAQKPSGIIWADYWCREMGDREVWPNPLAPNVHYSRQEGYVPAMAVMASPLELAQTLDPNRFNPGGSVGALMEAVNDNFAGDPNRFFTGYQSLTGYTEFFDWVFGTDGTGTSGSWGRWGEWRQRVEQVIRALKHSGESWHVGSGPTRYPFSWDMVTVRFGQVVKLDRPLL